MNCIRKLFKNIFAEFYIMNTLSISDSNKYLIKLLEKNKNFYICRLGIGPETYTPFYFHNHNTLTGIPSNLIKGLDNNNGIYCNSIEEVKSYCDLYIRSINESTAMAAFPHAIIKEQIALHNKKTPILHNRVLEPFYCLNEDIKPWSHYLYGKKVLIVNPFVDSFQKQIQNNFKMFKDDNKYIFHKDQQFVFYKSYVTSAGNHLHSNWIETFNIMKEDISKLDFDIALLGCGGYGLPLCNFIHKEMGKSTIYIGGGLQLLFGVMGKRWENLDFWKKLIQENDCKFIRPQGDEILKNNKRIEGGCFW
jgi:hypothetical protein